MTQLGLVATVLVFFGFTSAGAAPSDRPDGYSCTVSLDYAPSAVYAFIGATPPARPSWEHDFGRGVKATLNITQLGSLQIRILKGEKVVAQPIFDKKSKQFVITTGGVTVSCLDNKSKTW